MHDGGNGTGDSGKHIFSKKEIKKFYKIFKQNPQQAILMMIETGLKRLPRPDQIVRYTIEKTPEEAFEEIWGNDEILRAIRVGRGIWDLMYRQMQQRGVEFPPWNEIIDILVRPPSMMVYLEKYRQDLSSMIFNYDINRDLMNSGNEPLVMWFMRFIEIANEKLKDVQPAKVKKK